MGRRSMQKRLWATLGAAALLSTALAGAAEAAARCRNTANFDQWMAGFKQEAAAQGISRQAIVIAPFFSS